jgi:hypothetical protein
MLYVLLQIDILARDKWTQLAFYVHDLVMHAFHVSQEVRGSTRGKRAHVTLVILQFLVNRSYVSA